MDDRDSFEDLRPDDLDVDEAAMDTHITVLGVVHLLLASGFVVAGLVVRAAVGAAEPPSGNFAIFGARWTLGDLISTVLIALAVPGYVTGCGLLLRRSWGRTLGILMGIVNLPAFPLGTGFGLYSLWLLTHRDASDLFDDG